VIFSQILYAILGRRIDYDSATAAGLNGRRTALGLIGVTCVLSITLPTRIGTGACWNVHTAAVLCPHASLYDTVSFLSTTCGDLQFRRPRVRHASAMIVLVVLYSTL
jgi:hypothetical protein